MKHLAVVVDWYGPYSPENALLAARKDYKSGLYIGIGKRRYKHGLPSQFLNMSVLVPIWEPVSRTITNSRRLRGT